MKTKPEGVKRRVKIGKYSIRLAHPVTWEENQEKINRSREALNRKLKEWRK